MIMKFTDWIVLKEAEAAPAAAAPAAATGVGGGGGGGKNGLMGQTPFKEPTPSSAAPKNLVTYGGNAGCRGGQGLRKGGSNMCPDIDPSGESGGPGPKKGMGGGAAPAAGAASIAGGKTA